MKELFVEIIETMKKIIKVIVKEAEDNLKSIFKL